MIMKEIVRKFWCDFKSARFKYIDAFQMERTKARPVTTQQFPV